VVAEGVETEDQLSAVAQLGCQFIQGYVFSRPLSLGAIPDVLAQEQPQALALSSLKFPGESSRIH